MQENKYLQILLNVLTTKNFVGFQDKQYFTSLFANNLGQNKIKNYIYNLLANNFRCSRF